MNTIKMYLAESGRIADLKKDFPLYQGQYQNKLLNVFVPTSILAPNFSVQQAGQTIADYVSSTAVKIGMRTIERNGKIQTSKTYYMRYLKTLTYQNIEYALYERKLPREFTFYDGQGQNAPILIANVVNINNETSPATILDITTSQSCSLDVLPSDYLDKDEPIEASELAELSGQVNEINGILPTKQDKTDYSLETTNKTVVGAINENKSKIELNTANIESNREDIAKNREAIDGLNENLATGQDYIGTITTNTVPTEQTLNNFVLEERSVAPKGGDTIIVILQVSGDTDRNFKYIYNGTRWTYYEIPPMEQASNGTHGIIEGTYGIGLNNNTLVDISGGQILNIYVKDKDGNYQNIQTYLNMNAQDIEDIINGDSVVGESIKAMQDGLGNNIANTYLTQVLGATKQFVRDYAQPREFGNVYFISADGYSKQVPTTPESGVQFSVNTSAVASFQIFQIEKTNEASFELTSINGYSNNLYISASADCDVQYRLTTEYKKNGEEWNTLNVELSNVIPMRAGNIQRVQLNSPFTALGDNVISLVTGDKIRQTLAVVTQTSSPLIFNLYSNEIYPSTFTITSQSYILEDIDKAKSQIILIGADGVLESGKVVMTVQNSENFVEYRTNQREFLLDGNIPVVGEIDPTYPIKITFGETVYNLYSFMKGGNSPLTFGDIASSTTYNTNMGYSFDIRVMFIETSDIVGFVLSPSTLTAEQISNIIGEDGSVVATIGLDGKVVLTLDNTLQNKLMKSLVTPMTAPSNFELVGIDSSNSQAMVELGNRLVVENDELNLSDGTIRTVDFAESERQKSKNLFNINAPRVVQGGHTFVNGNTITVESGGSSEDDAVFGLIPVKENTTYYIGVYSNNQRIQFRLYDTNKNLVNQNPSGWTYNQYWQGSYKDFDTTDIITQMTIPSGVAYIAFFTAWFGGETIYSNLIVSEYADVGDYQPYNGAIVHEKDLLGVSSGLTLVGEIKLTSNASSITFSNVGGKVGDVYRLVVVGSSTSPNDGRVVFNGLGYNNYSMCELAGYTEGTSVSVQLLEECMIRTDVKGFFVDVNFGVTSNNNGSSIWIDSRNCSTSTSANKTTFFKYTQGFLPNQSSINTITISSGSPFYAGTSAKLYKVGN